MRFNVLDYVTAGGNARFAPSTGREYGTYGYTEASGSMLANVTEYRVADFDDVAYFYHTNGYKVDENFVYDGGTNLFDYIHTRYYYNFLQCSRCSIRIKNAVNDNTTLSSIAMRLNRGIRLWNPSSGLEIGDFSKDNVELSYMEEN